MYHPYLRGKQYELILLRENAELISAADIHPVIEPVRDDLGALRRALDALSESGASCTVVVNPRVGALADRPDFILEQLFTNRPDSWSRVDAGYFLHAESNLAEMHRAIDAHPEVGFSLVHGGYSNGRLLASELEGVDAVRRHVFLEGGKLYQTHLAKDGVQRILVRDGFKQQQKNAHYPESDHFSDLHITYPDEGMDGFGDYLMVGEEFTESGGPAYAVAIHLTYLDEERDMHAYHFVSDQKDSPTNPGGKFMEALAKLVTRAEREDTLILRTRAVEEFLDLSRREHYPGLGYVKKLSMQHHVELMADFLESVRVP